MPKRDEWPALSRCPACGSNDPRIAATFFFSIGCLDEFHSQRSRKAISDAWSKLRNLGQGDSLEEHENSFNVGTLTQPPICGIHDATMYWDCTSTAWLCQQCMRPDASPQATRPKNRMQELAEFAAGCENYEETVNSCSFLAAQPAAGTTPQAERPADILTRVLRSACVGQPAEIAWPHRLLHDAVEEIERLRSYWTEKEPCGHFKNFMMADEHGHFECQVCRAARAVAPVETPQEEATFKQRTIDCAKELREHYNSDWDSTVPGAEFDAEIIRILHRHFDRVPIKAPVETRPNRFSVYPWLNEVCKKSGWNVGRFVQFAEEHGHMDALADTLLAWKSENTPAVETPDIPERLWCSYPDCPCEREHNGVCQYKRSANSNFGKVIDKASRKCKCGCNYPDHFKASDGTPTLSATKKVYAQSSESMRNQNKEIAAQYGIDLHNLPPLPQGTDVETRLTAAQLATEILANHDDNYLGPNPKAAERKIKTLAAKIEAFRDKSEAELRAKLAEQERAK